MEIIVSHLSALAFWSHFTGNIASLRRIHCTTAATEPGRVTRELLNELSALGFHPSAEHPIDLIYADQKRRHRSSMVRAHVSAASYPDGSFIRLSDHVLIVSPEMAFIQAGSLPYGSLLMTGCQFCGIYALTGQKDDLAERPPLTSPTDIRAYLALCPDGIIGRRIRQAANHLMDNAASPQEARLALLLTLPHAQGGYALPEPTLNPPIPLGEAAYAIYGHSPCHPDLYWEGARLAVEYDGRDSHANRSDEDIARISALQVQGLKVITVNMRQLNDVGATRGIAEGISTHLGRHLHIRCRTFPERHARLRAELGLMAL